jgi:hypothetical protein
MAGSLNEAQARNFQRWPILGQAINPNWYAGDTYADEVKWMKEWIVARLAWIDRQFVQPPIFKSEADGKIALTAPQGKILFTLDGSDPRESGGAVLSKARTYESPVSSNPGAVVFARAIHNNRWSGPTLWKSDR